MDAVKGGFALGIDVGTTSAKAFVLGLEGFDYVQDAPMLLRPGPGGMMEQEVRELWNGVRLAVRRLMRDTGLGQDIRTVAFSSQGGTVIFLDASGSPLGNAISWMDTRPAALGPPLLGGRDDAFFYEKTGWSLQLGCLPLAQILRLRGEQSDWLRQARHVRFVDSYFVERFTGERATNPSDAAITLLYNVRERRWDPELLTLAGIGPAMLPLVVPSGTPVGKIRKKVAEELGISPEATVVVGGHDQYCAAYGAACTRPGDTIVSCGTAWVLLTMAAAPRFDREARLAPAQAVRGDLWGLLGSCSSVGAAVDWFRWSATPERGGLSFKRMEEAAAQVEPSADGMLYVPSGRGAGASLVGFALHHDFGHVARAVLEGPALSARGLLDRMRKAGCEPSALKAVGGAARSRFWMQVLADATGLPLDVPRIQEVASYGAARLAGEATGLIPGDAPWRGPAARLEPREQYREVYEKLYGRFRGC